MQSRNKQNINLERQLQMTTNIALSSVNDKMMSRMFQPVEDVVWNISTGSVGVLGNNGSIFSVVGEGKSAQVVEDLFSDFGMAIPAFAQNTQFDAVKLGDLVYRQSGKPGWVVAIHEFSLTLLNMDSSESTLRKPRTITMGMDQSGVMVLRNLFSTVGGGTQQNMQMLLPMLMANSSNSSDMVKMMLLSNMVAAQQPQSKVKLPPQPTLIQEQIPSTATIEEIRDICTRNNQALINYQQAVAAWSELVATTQQQPAPNTGAPTDMMQMMAMMSAFKGKGKPSLFD
jgi:hypothetical protein